MTQPPGLLLRHPLQNKAIEPTRAGWGVVNMLANVESCFGSLAPWRILGELPTAI